MTRLPLDDERWNDLAARSIPDEPIVENLRRLVEAPDDTEVFNELWPYLCSEDTPWPAAYASLPYLIDCAERVSPVGRVEYIIFFGYLCECTSTDSIPNEMQVSFVSSMKKALELSYSTLAAPLNDDHTLRHLLASFAALRGDKKLSVALRNFDSGCPHCGEELDWRVSSN